ncbi:MAG TPA: TraB/GumN family protein [Caulobacteraceae bacterium]|nr:TraB/GumN family protein [Caulobacteraceae bacterium]
MIWSSIGAIAASPVLAMAADRYPLWRLSSGRASIFLFGDCGSAANPWRSARVLRAFNAAAVFWKETPQIGAADAQLFLARGVDPGRPLSSWLTTDQRQRVAAAMALVGGAYADIEHYEPWLAAADLGRRDAARQPATSDPLAVLSSAAEAAHKPTRLEFPSAEALADYFASFSDRAQIEYLLNAVDIAEAGPAAWALRQAAWGRGDLSLETRQVLREKATYPEGYEAGTAARNRRWPGRFRTMLDAGGDAFVLVGADHLVGPEGVLAASEEAGIEVRRI